MVTTMRRVPLFEIGIIVFSVVLLLQMVPMESTGSSDQSQSYTGTCGETEFDWTCNSPIAYGTLQNESIGFSNDATGLQACKDRACAEMTGHCPWLLQNGTNSPRDICSDYCRGLQVAANNAYRCFSAVELSKNGACVPNPQLKDYTIPGPNGTTITQQGYFCSATQKNTYKCTCFKSAPEDGAVQQN